MKVLRRLITHTVLLVSLILSLNYPAFAASWTSGGPYGGKINSLAMSRTNPDVMYAGTPKGVYKTVDGSQSWVYAGLGGYGYINVVQIDPSNSNIIYAGTTSFNDAIFKSEDGGVTWDAKGLPQHNIKTIAIDPLNPLIVYVGTAPYSSEGEGGGSIRV